MTWYHISGATIKEVVVDGDDRPSGLGWWFKTRERAVEVLHLTLTHDIEKLEKKLAKKKLALEKLCGSLKQ